jgi:hypothetical protein
LAGWNTALDGAAADGAQVVFDEGFAEPHVLVDALGGLVEVDAEQSGFFGSDHLSGPVSEVAEQQLRALWVLQKRLCNRCRQRRQRTLVGALAEGLGVMLQQGLHMALRCAVGFVEFFWLFDEFVSFDIGVKLSGQVELERVVGGVEVLFIELCVELWVWQECVWNGSWLEGELAGAEQ